MVYADYAATHPYVKYPSSAYGPFLNPNANYAYKEKRLLSEAENRVKKAIGAKGGKVIFGGTSSQLIENLFTHIYDETNEYLTICSVYEHDSVWRFADQWGNIDSLKHAIQTYHGDKQLIVCLMGVNNLTGEIMPVEEIGKLCHKYNAFYICDATALLGHVVIEPNIDDWCDLLVLDGHKAGTELGIGCCWVSDRLNKWLDGFKLHGTPNLAGALAMTQAVEDACNIKAIEKNNLHWEKLSNKFDDLLDRNNIKHTFVPFVLDDYTCAINAIRLPGFNARSLQSYLASKEIYIGLGQSSCADEADRRVLCQGYGLSEQEADEVIRISFGKDSNIDEVKALIDGIVAFRKEYL